MSDGSGNCSGAKRRWNTYGDAADVGMPESRVKLHHGWPKGVFVGNLDIDDIGSTLVWSSRWALEATLEVGEVLPTACRFGLNFGRRIRMDVSDLLGNPPSTIRRHLAQILPERVQSRR